MKGDRKIWEAAKVALERLGGSGSIDAIFSRIIQDSLFKFGTTDPQDAPHVLDTELKRKCRNSNRTNKTGDDIFELHGSIYSLIAEPHSVMTSNKPSRVKRVHRAKDKEEIIAALTSDQVGVFKEIWRLLLFAAQVGFQEKRREPLASIDSGKGIDQSTFGNCPSWPGVSYLLTLVENNSSESLSGDSNAEDSRLSVFEEYANGGLSVMGEYFRGRIIDLDSVLSFVDLRSRRASQEPDLELSI